MLERELTLSDGTIAKNLPKGFTWLRLGDTGGKEKNKLGCDGFLFHGTECWITEVKVGNGKLTDNEHKLMVWCLERRISYIILRFFPDNNLWAIDIEKDRFADVDLKICIESLID